MQRLANTLEYIILFQQMSLGDDQLFSARQASTASPTLRKSQWCSYIVFLHRWRYALTFPVSSLLRRR